MYGKLVQRTTLCRLLLMTICVLAVVVAGANPLSAQDPAAEAVKQFNERLQQYADLHERAVRSAGPVKETDDPAVILRQEKQIQDGIRAARQGTSEGDIFIPVIRPIIVDII
jgi:hypothetical protein